MMNYREFQSSDDLRPFVRCYWVLEDQGDQRPVKQRVVPDGCMEMIFHYGDPYLQYLPGGNRVIQPRCFLFGQITRYIEIEPTGRSGIFSVRFQPEGASPLLRIPPAELEDRAAPLDQIFGDAGKKLGEDILAAPGTGDRIRIVEEFLYSLPVNAAAVDRLATDCVNEIIRSKGQTSIDLLADQLDVKQRQLQRKFSSVIGMSPKQLARAIRFQKTIRSMNSGRFDSLTSLAYENGYYDQSHFIRDFREFTGASPKSFFSDNFRFASFFASAE